MQKIGSEAIFVFCLLACMLCAGIGYKVGQQSMKIDTVIGNSTKQIEISLNGGAVLVGNSLRYNYENKFSDQLWNWFVLEKQDGSLSIVNPINVRQIRIVE